jgi:hypothetical protein
MATNPDNEKVLKECVAMVTSLQPQFPDIPAKQLAGEIAVSEAV